MAQRIVLPNGDNLDFPDGMADKDIETAIQSEYPEYAPKQSLLSRVGSAAKAAASGTINNFKDAVGYSPEPEQEPASVMGQLSPDTQAASAAKQGSQFSPDGRITGVADRAMDIGVNRALMPKAKNAEQPHVFAQVEKRGSPRIADHENDTIKPEAMLADSAQGLAKNAGDLTDKANERHNIKKFTEDYPYLAGAISGTAGMVSGIEDFVPLAADTVNQIINPWIKAAGGSGFSDAARLPGAEYFEQVQKGYTPEIAKKKLDDLKDGELPDWLAAKAATLAPQIGASMGAALVPKIRALYLGAMGGMSAGQQYTQDKQEGIDKGSAIADSWTNGAIEILSEMLPLHVFDKVQGALRKLPMAARAGVIGEIFQKTLAATGAFATQSGTEGVEEMVAQFGHNVSKKYNAGDSKVNLTEGVKEAGVLGAMMGAPTGLIHAGTVAKGFAEDSPAGLARAMDEAVNNTDFTQRGIDAGVIASMSPNPVQVPAGKIVPERGVLTRAANVAASMGVLPQQQDNALLADVQGLAYPEGETHGATAEPRAGGLDTGSLPAGSDNAGGIHGNGLPVDGNGVPVADGAGQPGLAGPDAGSAGAGGPAGNGGREGVVTPAAPLPGGQYLPKAPAPKAVAPVVEAPAEPKAFSIGTMPNNAEPITVQGGAIYIGKYPAQHFETGEDITVKPGASKAQIRDALKAAGAIGRGVKVFGIEKEAPKSKVKAKRIVDNTRDSLITAIGKLGGFHTDSVEANDIRTLLGVTGNMKIPVGSGLPVFLFNKNGKKPDDMAGALHEHGYLDEHDMNDMLDKLYNDKDQGSKYAQHQRGEEPEQEHEGVRHGYDDLPEADQAAVSEVVAEAEDMLDDIPFMDIRTANKVTSKQFKTIEEEEEAIFGGYNETTHEGTAAGTEGGYGETDASSAQSRGEDHPGEAPGESAGVDSPSQGFSLEGQSETDLTAKEARESDEKAAERARIKAESEALPGAFTLTSNEKPQALAESEGKAKTGDMFIQPDGQQEKLPVRDIKIGDELLIDGEIYTVTAGIKDGVKAERKISGHQSSVRLVHGDDVIRTKLAAENNKSSEESRQSTDSNSLSTAEDNKTASQPTGKPSANTVFTEDAAAAARALLKKKLVQVNTGLDPEVMQAGITLAGYHIEKGARTFTAYAKAMVDDLGDVVKPYLKSWFLGVKFDPRAAAFSGEMDSAASVEAHQIEPIGNNGDFDAPNHSIVAQPNADYTDVYETVETRPDTRPEQLAAGRGALADAERRILGRHHSAMPGGATLLGSRISADFRSNGGTSLVGQEITGPEDLAFVAQVLRDPRFETFRVFYTDDAGKIVGERAYSSRLAGAVYIPEDHSVQMRADMAEHKATGYWLLHNHPSGSANESDSDLKLTANVARMVKGFQGHVVIDHNEYNHISVNGMAASGKVVKAPQLAAIDLLANPEKAHPLLGSVVSGPAVLAELAKRLQTKDGYVVLIGTDAQRRISLLTEVPVGYTKGRSGNKVQSLRSVAALKRATRETGSTALFAAVPGNLMEFSALIDSGLFRDVVTMDGKSAEGMIWWEGLPNTKAERRGGKSMVAHPAWHGSPYDHDGFSMEHVGTGEGAQAYGFGLYFAGSREVAEWYKTKMSGGSDISTLRATKDGKDLSGYDLLEEYFKPGRQVKGYAGIDEVVSFSPQQYGKPWHVTVKQVLDQFGNKPKSWDAKPRSHATQPDAKLVKEVLESDGWKVSKGRLYQVELAPAQDEYLDWDKPLSEQSEKVRAALENTKSEMKGWDHGGITYPNANKITGEGLYGAIEREHGSAKSASEYLHSIGIRGIRYLDGSSRSAGEGNSNYVIFDDKDVTISEKFDQPVPGYGNAPTRQQQIPSITIPEETKSQAAQRVVQDKFNRFKVLQDWVKSQGMDLSEAADVYLAETLMSGRISTRKQDFRENQMGPLIQKTQSAGISLEQVGEFLKIQHAPEANKRAREIHHDPDATAYGVTDQDASDAMDEFKRLPNFAEIKAISNEWRSITGKTKQILLDAGILSEEMAQAWDSTYSQYVPVKGMEDQPGNGTGKGLNVNGRQKKRLGHELRDEGIIENILRDHERAISLDEKNLVGKSLIRFALAAKNPDIITVSQPVKRQVLKEGQAHYMVTHHGADIAGFDNLNDARRHLADESLKVGGDKRDFDIAKTSDPVRVMLQASPMLADNEVNVYVAGHAIRVQINDEIAARAYTSLGVEHLNAVLSAGRAVNTWLSKAYTGYSPDFIFTNPIRDAIQGAITLTGNYGAGLAAKIFSNYPLAVKELSKHFRKPGSSSIVTDYRANGGSTGAAYLSDLERIGDDIQASYNEYAGMINTYQRTYAKAIEEGEGVAKANSLAILKSGASGFKNIPVIGHFLSLMEHINALTENALRVATYHALVKEGVSKPRAAEQAKNLMNFNRKGEISNQAGALYLFFNPNVQGSQVIYRALVESEHKGQARALAGTMVLSAMALAALACGGGDDDKEKWNNTPDYVKDGNLVIGYGDYQITLPLPYGYRVFHTLGNVMFDYAQGIDGYKLGIRLASSVFSNFSPVGNPMEGEHGLFQIMPTIPKMILGPGVNEDSFGRAITPKRFNEAKPDSQMMNRTSKGTLYASTAEGLNALTGGTKYEKGAIDVSPETLKYWVKSITGGAGQFAMDAINIPTMAAQGVEPQSPKEIPILRRFVRETGVSDTRSAFWDRANEAKKSADAFGEARKNRDIGAAREILKENKDLIELSHYAENTQKMAKAKRDEIDRIKNDDNLSLLQKTNKMKLIENEESAIYTRFIRQFDKKIAATKAASK